MTRQQIVHVLNYLLPSLFSNHIGVQNIQVQSATREDQTV